MDSSNPGVAKSIAAANMETLMVLPNLKIKTIKKNELVAIKAQWKVYSTPCHPSTQPL